MKRWQIFSAVALRRLPAIIPERDAITLKVQQIFSAQEVSMSKYSNHELEHQQDIRAKENPDAETSLKETALDKEDRWRAEYSKFQPAPYNPRLAVSQYLFVRQKFSTDIKDQWLLPQAMYDASQDNDLMDTGRRALNNLLGIVNGYRILSKIPSSCYSFSYPKKIVELTGFDGARVFFLKAHMDDPDHRVESAVDPAKHQDLLRWLTRREAIESVNRKYLNALERGLLHEERVDIKKVLASASSYIEATRARKFL